MRKRLLPFYTLVALCAMLLCRTAYAIDAPFRLELRTQGDAAMARPYETWFFLEDGRAYATTGELCAYAKAPAEGGAEVITLAGGPFANDAIVVDAEGATAAAERSGVACGFGVAAMPTPFRARLAGSASDGAVTFTASLTGGVGDAFAYRYHVYDGAGSLVCGDVRDGALSVAPAEGGTYEAFVTATDAAGEVSDCASAAVALPSGTGTALGAGTAGDAFEPSDEDGGERLALRQDGGVRPEAPDVPVEPVEPAKPDKPDEPVEPVDPEVTTLPINREARDSIKGLQLYANPEGTGAQAVTNPNFNGSFDADVYRSIREDPLRGDGEAELTVMIYLCGTDLEAKSGLASRDLINVLNTRYDLSQVNVLVLAGGTMSWKSEVMRQNNNDVRVCLYYLDPNGVKGDAGDSPAALDQVLCGDSADGKGSLRLLGSYDQACMGDPELLLGFLDTAYDLFPADHYWLSLWDHGGGSAEGICFGQAVTKEKNASAFRGTDISDDPLTLANIEEALGSSKIVGERGDLDILSMDACLMAGIEEAYNFSPYVRFMVASEETTTGSVPYDDYLGMFRKLEGDESGNMGMSAGEIAVNAARSFVAKGRSEGIEPATMAVFDLMRVDECADAMNGFGYAMSALLQDDETSQQAAACLEKSAFRTSNFGHSDDEGENYVDLYDLLSRLKTYLAHEQQAVPEDSEAHVLYQTAMESISELLRVPFVAYRGGLYAGSHIVQEDMTHEEDALTLDMSGTAATGLWGVLGYDNLCGVTVYFPRTVSKVDLTPYSQQDVFPGYVDMLERYVKIVRSEEHLKDYKDACKSLSGNLDSLIDGMRIRKCAYTDKDGKERHGLALYVSFREDVDPALTNGLDPVALFSHAIKSYDVLVLRSRPATPAGDDEGYDIVIGRSERLHSGECTTGSVTMDERTGELRDVSGLAVDLSLLEMEGHLVTATEGGAEGARIEDWGLAYAYEDLLRKSIQEEDPAYAKSWKDDFSGLQGVVHATGDDGANVTYDAVLIFGKDGTDNRYTYKGAFREGTDGKGDKDASSEDLWIPADADNVLGITLYHFRLNESGDGLVRVENKDELDGPTFSFQKGAYPTMQTVDLTKPDGTGMESQESNRYALEINERTDTTSVCVIDDVSLDLNADGGGPADGGSTTTGKSEKAAGQDGEETREEAGNESGQAGVVKAREATSASGSAGQTEPTTTGEASSAEATDSSKESCSTEVAGTSKAADSSKESDTAKETDTAKATDATKESSSAKVTDTSKGSDSPETTGLSKETGTAKESSASKATDATKESASTKVTDTAKAIETTQGTDSSEKAASPEANGSEEASSGLGRL